MNIAIIGAGLTGLVAGYRLSQKGHKVTIFEKSDDIGGLMGGFEIEGTSLEKAYHHIFSTDNYIIDLAKELGVYKNISWHDDNVAVYYDGEMYPFMGAVDLLKFKPLSLLSKIRLGLVKIWLQMDNNWHKYENVLAYEWMKKWCGQEAYKVIWEPLLRGKFHNKYKEVSMAWLWARIHTRGGAKLGYFEGGFKQIADKLAEKINKNGGEIKLKQAIDPTRLLRRDAPRKDDSLFDKVLYTGPSKEVEYIGAVELVFTSKQNLSPYYWHNINDIKSPFLCFIQHTNLVDKKFYGNKQVYYLGYYGDENVSVDNWFEYLKEIFPKFDEKMVLQKWVFRFKNAQHIVTTNYKPSPYPSLDRAGFYTANFSQIYPEDRGTNFAVREGEKVAKKMML